MTDKTMNPDYQRAVSEFVSRNVVCCVSTLVATVADGAEFLMRSRPGKKPLADLVYQAADLALPVLDYEEAARQAGWTLTTAPLEYVNKAEKTVNYEQLCADLHIEPYDREVFEHWAVSEWFADRLEERGERVDRDFAGLIVWARTTTGQAISMDGVVTEIYDAWQKELARMISGVGPAETVVA